MGLFDRDPNKKKLPGPKAIPDKVSKYIVSALKEDAKYLTFLMSVTHISENNMQEMRIYDPGEAEASKVQVANYETLNAHPELIIFELTADAKLDNIQVRQKKKVDQNITILSEAEIQKKIEALGESGETSIMFYTAAGPNAGGPLGRGCAIVDLNSEFPTKSNKKYIISTDDVINMKPAGRKVKLFDSKKAKDVASWLKQAHRERFV